MKHNCNKINQPSLCLKRTEVIKGQDIIPVFINCKRVQNPKRFLISHNRIISTVF